MKKYLCKSLALSMTFLNLCNPVSALSEDIQQENVTNNESNLKSYAIKGAKIVGGIFVAMLAGAGVYSSLNIGKRWILKNENMKRLGVDKEIYDSMYKVYHTRDLLSRDFTVQDRENFAEYIYGMYRILDEEPRFIPDNFANVKMSKEEVKIYTCIQLVYVGFFRDDVKISGDKNGLRDIDRVYIDNAFRAFMESDFYKRRNIKEDSKESYMIKYYEFIKNLLLPNESVIWYFDGKELRTKNVYDLGSLSPEWIKGDYLEKFKEELDAIISELRGSVYISREDLEGPDPKSDPSAEGLVAKAKDKEEKICKSINKLREEFQNNVIKVRFPKSVRCSKEMLDKFNVLELYDYRILRIGTFKLNLEEEWQLLEGCMESLELNPNSIPAGNIATSLEKLREAIRKARRVLSEIMNEKKVN